MSMTLGLLLAIRAYYVYGHLQLWFLSHFTSASAASICQMNEASNVGTQRPVQYTQGCHIPLAVQVARVASLTCAYSSHVSVGCFTPHIEDRQSQRPSSY